MELLAIGDKTCVLGCRWKTATGMAKIGKDEWLAKWQADTYLIINCEGKRYSLGAIEKSASEDFVVSKRKLYSLAGIVNSEIKNGIALFEIKDSYGDIRYWVALFHDGVPELDFSSTDLVQIVNTLSSKLTDTIDNILSVPSPVFMTNMNHNSSDCEFSSLFDLRDFNIVTRGYDELHLMAESAKTGLMKVDGSLLSTQFVRDLSGQKKKDFFYYFISILLLGIGATYLLVDFGGDDFIDNYSPVVQPVLVQKKTESSISDEVQKSVEKTLKDFLIGSNLGLYRKMVSRYESLDRFVFGYNKKGITCAVQLARCEVEFSTDFSYREFDKALRVLRGKFDDVVFDIKGDTFTGIWKILPSDVYLVTHRLSDLPINDGGESLVNDAIMLSSTRPMLNVTISGAARVSVDLGNIASKSIPEEIETTFIQVGWNAKGIGHHADIVISALQRKFLTLNHFKVSTDGGFDNMELTGSYIMREKPNE